MNFPIHLIETSGYLKPLEDIIRKKTEEAIPKIITKLPINNIDIVIFDQRDDPYNSAQVGPQTGIGQYYLSHNLLSIALDARNNSLQESLTNSTLLSAIAHGLYHCMRGRSMHWIRNPLIEAFISEGLAGHFEFEITQTFSPDIYHTLTPEALSTFQKKAEKEYWSEKYSYTNWFLGGDPEIPYGAGHSFGYKLVKDYLQKNSHELASTLYDKQPQEFIK